MADTQKTKSQYLENFANLEEDSVNFKLIPLYNGLPKCNVEYELPILCQVMTGKKKKLRLQIIKE